MTDSDELQELIRKTIPLSEAMKFEIQTLESYRIQTYAPLSPNINIHGTGFAGSLYSIAALTAWGLVTHCCKVNGVPMNLVIAHANISYRKPIEHDISCFSALEDSVVDSFIGTLKIQGRAKLEVCVDVNERAAQLTALLVAKL